MALATIQAALDQYNANLSWQTSTASATLALEALRFLTVNRAKMAADQGSSMTFEDISKEKDKIEAFLGIGSPRAFGRSRRVRVAFQPDGGQ